MKGRAILVNDMADARAAAAAAAALGVPVLLMSAPSGAAALGPGWWRAMVLRLGAEHPQVDCTAVLDCGDRPDLVQAGLRIGLRHLCFRGPERVARKLQDMAAQYGATLHRRCGEPLDLSHVVDREAACRAWLSEGGATGRRLKRPDGSAIQTRAAEPAAGSPWSRRTAPEETRS